MDAEDERAGLWQALCFPLPYNWGENFIRDNGKWHALNPIVNPEARIVYLYRNPLDHFVSYFRHAQGHVDASHQSRTLADGTVAPIRDLREFVFDAGMLGAFIKHYYSFRQMQARSPQQVLMMPYEQLTTTPDLAFAEILAFFGAPVDDPLKQRLFGDALALCSKESLMAVEAKLAGSIAGDQKAGEKHIRGGEIGKWARHFSDVDLERIEAAFGLFGMSLREFELSGGRDLSWLSSTPEATLQAHRITFLEQELTLAGIAAKATPHPGKAARWLTHAKARMMSTLRRSPLGPSLRAARQKLRARPSLPVQ